MTPVMNAGTPGRCSSVFCALVAGFLLGAAAVTGCARAEKAPVLPATRVNWAQAVAGPRQVLIVGRAPDVDQRANNLLLQGWRIVPGSVALAASTDGGAAMLALEQKPRKVTP